MESKRVDTQENNYQLEVSRATLERKGFKNNNHFLPEVRRKQIRDASEDIERVAYYFKEFKNNFNDDISQPVSTR